MSTVIDDYDLHQFSFSLREPTKWADLSETGDVNVNIKELERFFGLMSNRIYSASDIENREYAIRQTLTMSGHIDMRVNADLIEFMRLDKKVDRCEM